MPAFKNLALFIFKRAEGKHLPWLKSIIKKNRTKHTKAKPKQKSCPYLHLTYIITLKQPVVSCTLLLSFSCNPLNIAGNSNQPLLRMKEVILKSFIVALYFVIRNWSGIKKMKVFWEIPLTFSVYNKMVHSCKCLKG